MSADPLRDARNREALATHDLDAVVCRLPENVLLLTGYWPLSSVAFALFPCEGPAALIAVDTEVASIPEGAIETVREFPWGVLGATDPHGDIRRHLGELVQGAGLSRARIGY